MRSRASSCRLAVLVAVALASLVTVAQPAKADAPLEFTRAAGDDRYSTAAVLAAGLYQPGGFVFVATGRDYPDAMAAGPAAAVAGAPVLLTEPNELPASTQEALEILEPRDIILVGGEAAVSEDVRTLLEGFVLEGGHVVRIAGPDRYATAVELADFVFPETRDKVYLATGTNFPDALAAGGSAGADVAPLLLTRPDDVPDVVLAKIDSLDPAEVVLLGGTAAISDAVKGEVETVVGNVVRRAGATRFDTAAALSAASFEVQGGHEVGANAGQPAIFLVNGGRFPDALAAGAPAGAISGPVLLTEKECIPKVTNDEINRIAAALPAETPLDIIVVGGFDVIGDLVVIDHKVCA